MNNDNNSNDGSSSSKIIEKGNKKAKRKNKLLTATISFIIIILIIFLTIGGGYGILKERVQRVVAAYKTQKAIKQFNQGLNEYYQKFAEDTYGGKTPQETLDMFIEALEKGDIDLASKYFALDDNLSRKKWEDALKTQANDGKMQDLINITKQFKPASNQINLNTIYEFVVIGSDGLVKYSVEMEYNEYSGVWKIKSM